MEYTEIPTDLLGEVWSLFEWIKQEYDGVTLSADASFPVRFNADDMDRMEPLIKWLEYIGATWAAED